MLAQEVGTGQYEIQDLNARHHEIIRLLSLGLRNTEIADALRISPVTVSYVRNSELGRKKLDELMGRIDDNVVDLQQRMKVLAPTALDTLEDLMHSRETSSAVRANIAKDLLDRAGHAAVKRVETISALLTAEDIEHLKQKAREHSHYGPVVTTSCKDAEDA